MDVDLMARQKLNRIIEREGDGNGERLKPYYLEMLKNEIAKAEMVTTFCLTCNAL